MRAIGYARESKARHDDAESSLPAQRAAITAACEARAWTLLDVLEDNGRSGREGKKRPRLDEAVRRVEAGEADVLVVHRLNRFRSTVDFGKLLSRARENGWALKLLEPDVDTTTAMGRGVANVMVATFQMQAELDGEVAADIHARRKARGDRTGGKRQIPASVRARIKRERRAGRTLQAIADRLNAAGVPTAHGSAAGWKRQTIAAVLRQEQAA